MHLPSQLRILNADDVRALLPMDRAVELMRTAMVRVSEGRTVQPIRQAVRTPDGKGLMGWMPGYVADPERLRIKVITIFPHAVAEGLKSHQGMVLLFDTTNGLPSAMLDAGQITAIRTAAATAVATDVLARPDATKLSIFGCGEQAETHLDALRLVRPFDRVRVWGRDFDKARAFCAEHPGCEAVEDAETCARGADVITLVTGSFEPVFAGAWLERGQHLNAVGASLPTAAEVDVEAVVRSRYFVDYRDSALALAGELKRARQAGAVDDSHVAGEIGQVLLGEVGGRRSADDITQFKSLGMAAEDLVSADWILAEAERTGAGLTIPW